MNDQLKANYDAVDEIIFNTDVLKLNLCNYNDAYILVRSNITIVGYTAAWVTFKSCAPFISYITKVDGTKINDAEDLDLVMPMYYLLECSSNYSDKTGSLWFCSKMKQPIFMLILQIMLILDLSSIKLN